MDRYATLFENELGERAEIEITKRVEENDNGDEFDMFHIHLAKPHYENETQMWTRQEAEKVIRGLCTILGKRVEEYI